MSLFDEYSKGAIKCIKYSDNKQTRDVAMCQIFTGLTYAILTLACAVKEKETRKINPQLSELEKENKKLRKIANKALDDKNKLLDERLKSLEVKEFLDD